MAGNKQSEEQMHQSGKDLENDLHNLLQNLEIREDEEQGIVLEEDLEELKAEARWTVLAKVSSLKTFSHSAFIENMKYAWSLAKDFSFKAIEENLFELKFSCLGDWRKVMEEGPWFFRGHAVLLEEYDGITKPSKVKFKYLAVWVRIYDLPTGFRTENIGRQLGNKIGVFIKVDLDEASNGWRDYLRIRVKLDVEKPLTRVVYILLGDGKREAFRVKYERLPKFCAVCGLLGHGESECGDGVHNKKALQYGDWLIANLERKGKIKGSKSTSLTDMKGSDSRDSTKSFFLERNSDPRSDNNNIRDSNASVDLKDDGRSPLKRDSDRHLKFDREGDKKFLTLGDAVLPESNNMALAVIPAIKMVMNLVQNLEEKDGQTLWLGSEVSESSKDKFSIERNQKRLRIHEKDAENDFVMRSAGSPEEYRREQ